MDPALPAVRAQDQPVDALPIEELDFVAPVEKADLLSAQFIGSVEQAHEPIADLPTLEGLQRARTCSIEGHWSGNLSAHRVSLANLLQRRPAPAGHERFVGGDRRSGGHDLVSDSRASPRTGCRFDRDRFVAPAALEEDQECEPGDEGCNGPHQRSHQGGVNRHGVIAEVGGGTTAGLDDGTGALSRGDGEKAVG
jgi:hypothetical protein